MISQRFSPMSHIDSFKDDSHSGDEYQSSPIKHNERHIPSHSSHRSQSPFANQGQSFQTAQSAPSPVSNPISRLSVDSRSSSSQHHHHRRHHHRHGHNRNESPSNYPQRPRTPSPTPHVQRAPHEHTANSRPHSRPSDPALSNEPSVYGQQQPSALAHVSQSNRQSSYIVSICTDIDWSQSNNKCDLPFSNLISRSLSPLLHCIGFEFDHIYRSMFYLCLHYAYGVFV